MIKICLAATVFMLYSNLSLGQCSDAGVCAIGSSHEPLRHSLSVRYIFGKSEKTDRLTFHSVNIEGSFHILRDSRIDVILPWMHTSGPLGSTMGASDLTVLWNQVIWNENGNRLGIQVGGKFATGNDNSGSLPQAYQPGLGTNDLLLGILYESEPWLFALGYQLPGGRSANSLTRLKRGDDLLVKAAYDTRIDDLTVGLEILAIKRLQESSVLDPFDAGENAFIVLSGSNQFQTNLLVRAALPLSEIYALRGLVAAPLRSRSVNVDGLTRTITVSLGILFSI